MNRVPIREQLSRIEILAHEIDENVASTSPRLAGFRSDLAGLVTVTSCATYENCVKMVIHEYSGRQSELFEVYTKTKYNKINSKITVGDLKSYAKTFHPELGRRFSERLSKVRDYYLRRTSEDICMAYSQMLQWRHTFAHSGDRVTTVEEVIHHHKLGKRVLLSFSDAFSEFPLSQS